MWSHVWRWICVVSTSSLAQGTPPAWFGRSYSRFAATSKLQTWIIMEEIISLHHYTESHECSCFCNVGWFLQRSVTAAGAGALRPRPGGHVRGYQHWVGYGNLGVKGQSKSAQHLLNSWPAGVLIFLTMWHHPGVLTLHICVSVTQDGTVIMHSVRRGQYLRTLRLPCEGCISAPVARLEVGMEGHIVAHTVTEGRSVGKVLTDKEH